MSTSNAPPSPAPTRVGRYVLFDEIARGGMASVHLARVDGAGGFSRVVAVKRLHAIRSEREDERRTLLLEAKITSRIRHPNVVPVLDAVLDAGALHLVMDYVHGATLSELARELAITRDRAPLEIAVAVVADMLRGLHAAHEARDARGAPLGIVHRDVSPQNVIVGVDGHARLLDFGIAKSLDRTRVTEAGVIKGKLGYMPREQLAGAPLTRQADVYAAGVVLWELLTGASLYGDADAARIAGRLATEDVPPPSRDVPSLPAPLDRVVLRATAHDAPRRYATAAEMLADLVQACPAADAHDVGAWVERLAGDALELRLERVRHAENAKLEEVAQPTPKRASRARRALPWVGAGALGVAGLLAFSATRTAGGVAPSTDEASSSPVRAAAPSLDLPIPEPVVLPADVPAEEPSTPAAAPARAHVAAKHRATACDPPFSIDANGRKHYKPECLR